MKKIILPIAIAAYVLPVQFVPAAASDSKPAKFVVFLVKKQGVPALLPAK